jgi:hypothetical protein
LLKNAGFNRFEKHNPVETKSTLSLTFKYAVCNTAYPKNGTKVSLRSVARQFNVQPTQIRKRKKILEENFRQTESTIRK